MSYNPAYVYVVLLRVRFLNKLYIVIAGYGCKSNNCLQKVWPKFLCYSVLPFTHLQHLLESHDAFRDVAILLLK